VLGVQDRRNREFETTYLSPLYKQFQAATSTLDQQLVSAKASPIQAMAIHLLLNGRDVVGQRRTSLTSAWRERIKTERLT